MFSVIKLGGTNGSGKTTVATALLEVAKGLPDKWAGNKKNPNFYRGEYRGLEVLVLGSYASACGGMDTISDKHERLAFVEWACQPGRIVFFEGLITGKTYGALGELSEQHVYANRGRWLYAFMDTPFEVCVARVLQRRQAAGNHNPFDPERTLRSTHRSCLHLSQRIAQTRESRAGSVHPHPLIMLDHSKQPAALARQLLQRAEALAT